MLEKFIPQLIKDLELEDTNLASGMPGIYSIPLEENLSVTLNDIPEGFIVRCDVAPIPNSQEEKFYTRAMLGNLFGQGTRGNAIIGISQDGSKVTLSLVIDRPIDYKEFRELLEDFLNAVDFWRDETLSFNKKT